MDLITVNYPNFKQLHAVGTGRQGMVEEFETVFDGSALGHLPGLVTFQTEDGSKPVQCPPRRVPIAVQAQLRDELETCQTQCHNSRYRTDQLVLANLSANQEN